MEGEWSRKVERAERVEWCRHGKEAGGGVGWRVVEASYRRSPPIVVQEGGGSIEGHAWRAAGPRADARGGVFHFPFSKIRAAPSRGQETHRGRRGNGTSGEREMGRALTDSSPQNALFIGDFSTYANPFYVFLFSKHKANCTKLRITPKEKCIYE